MEEISDSDFESYVPYISKVTGHWYRNVYFTEEALGDKKIVQTDDDYEKKTGERWTLYETNSKGGYELYVYLKNVDSK